MELLILRKLEPKKLQQLLPILSLLRLAKQGKQRTLKRRTGRKTKNNGTYIWADQIEEDSDEDEIPDNIQSEEEKGGNAIDEEDQSANGNANVARTEEQLQTTKEVDPTINNSVDHTYIGGKMAEAERGIGADINFDDPGWTGIDNTIDIAANSKLKDSAKT